MKKLLILALVLVVAGGLFAQVTITGQVNYGVLAPLAARADVKGDPSALQYNDSRIAFTAKLDDFTSAIFRIRSNATTGSMAGVQGTVSAIKLNRAFVQSDVAGYFGLGKSGVSSIVYMGGYWGGAADLSDGISRSAVADVSVNSKGGDNTFIGNATTIMNMVTIRFGVFPGDFIVNKGGMIVSGTVTVNPVAVDLAYSNYGMASEIGKGYFSGSARFMQAIAPVDLAAYAGLGYDLNAEQLRYGVAARVKYQTLLTAWVGFTGFDKGKALAPVSGAGGAGYAWVNPVDASWFDRMEISAVIMPVDVFSLDISAELNMNAEKTAVSSIALADPTKNILNALDFRANLHVSKTAVFSVGYLMFGAEGYTSWLSAELGRVGTVAGGKGGLYFETKTTF